MQGPDLSQQDHVNSGFWIRSVAGAIDWILILIAALILHYLAGPVIDFLTNFIVGFFFGFVPALAVGHREPMSLLAMQMTAFLARILYGVLVAWVYFAVLESSKHQATLGKRLFKLRVADENGAPISFGRATGRFYAKTLSTMILCIGFLMAGWTKRKQGLHDLMVGTQVIKPLRAVSATVS